MARKLNYRIDTLINQEMRDGIDAVCQINVITPSVYLRQLIVRDLIDRGIMEQPAIKRTTEINGAENAISAP
jgi:hypothetical protein